MKRKFLFCALLAALLCLLAVTAAAGDPQDLSPEDWGDGLYHVTDQANVLSSEEESSLSQRAAEISEKYGCTVYIIIMDDYKKYTYGYSIENCGDDIYDGYDLNSVGKGDCVILLHSLKERDYDIMAHGDFGNASFTDYGKEVMAEKIVSKLKKSDWYGAYDVFLEQCDRMLELSAKGEPYDITTFRLIMRNCLWAFTHPSLEGILTALVTGGILALIFTSIAADRLKSVKKKTDAKEYMVQGSTVVTERSDQYTHTTTTSRDAPKRGRSGGGGRGGGGTTVNSRGSSHSSGKY